MTTLLVPIALDVLVVRPGDADAEWALTKLDVPKPQARGRRRHQLVPDPFQRMEPGRAPGAYLHWALPDALTHGEPSAGEHGFPPVPNRWLIVRLSGPVREMGRKVDAWLLPDSGAAQPVCLEHALSGPPLPTSDASPVAPLTALGHGDLGWAAYYDNVVHRFALHDTLTDVVGPVSYVVCGFFTNPAHEPIAAASEVAFLGRMAQLRWHAELPSGLPFPTRSLYHAYAVCIGWPEPRFEGDGGVLAHELDLRPDRATATVAIGESLAEAVAALLPEGTDRGASRLIEGALANQLADIASADGPATLETALHVSRFGSAPAKDNDATEYIWEPAPPAAGGVDDGVFRSVRRTRPRVYHALDPHIVVQGGGRSPKHGGDGRYTSSSELVCRVAEQALTAFGIEGGELGRGVDVLPNAALASLPESYGVPEVAAALLVELACIDPSSAPDLDRATATAPSPVSAMRARLWLGLDPGSNPTEALDGAHIEGTLPSLVALTPPTRPWSPLHLEWSAAYRPSPAGIHDWSLEQVDFELSPEHGRSPIDPNHALSGRALLSAAPAALLREATSDDEVAAADLVTAPLAEIDQQLRGDPRSAVVTAPDDARDVPQGARPAHYVPLRAGLLELERLRLVDGYGQTLELIGSEVEDLPLRVGASLQVPDQPDLIAFRPRFTAPARVLLRFADANGEHVEAGGGVSPICGYVVASPRDGTLEFFDADGAAYGRLRPDDVAGTAWEDDPGRISTAGTLPSAQIPNRFLGAIADAILSADLGVITDRTRPPVTALRALMQVLDVTRWTVDLTGRSGDEHIALLLGQPIAVVRAVLQIDVDDPRKPVENKETAVKVKLGTLAHLQDGLLAYFAGDAFERVHVVDPAVPSLADGMLRGSVASPFVDPRGHFEVNAGAALPLTLLMLPGTDVHVTTGLLPQKKVGLMREWTASALDTLSPLLRFGPILRDPEATRLPVAPDIRGTWTFHYRDSRTSWRHDEVVPATTSALLPDSQLAAAEGYLQVALLPDTEYPQSTIALQVTCVRSSSAGAGRHILAIGGRNPNQTSFLLPVAKAVQMVESRRFSFFVHQGGLNPVEVQVVSSGRGGKYLRTTRDTSNVNNLLNLPEVDEEFF